jgi:16S rRNA processing protein RimM
VELQSDHGPSEPALDNSGWVQAGVIIRAHGVRGEIRVRFDMSPTQLLQPLDAVRVVPRRGASSIMHVTNCREIHDAALVTFKEVPSREAAQLLHGARLELPEASIPPMDEESAYMYELHGAEVQDGQGVVLGVVQRVDDNGGQALLVMAHPTEGERLLPLVSDTFAGFHRERRVLTVNVPEGLWE